ncbi:hypothetical protein niasHS_001051 [Heterodera schachtii]|uniref:Cytochrome b-c1 complex subunit Rieske transmembrane domain-containing protein n=1 Tax=Heterodera schachtii TaxID=97005 RepID=A0ABD2K829_HETSC
MCPTRRQCCCCTTFDDSLFNALPLGRQAVHNDVQFPNFDAFRNEFTKDPTQPSHVIEDRRKGVSSFIFDGAINRLNIGDARSTERQQSNFFSC